LFTPYPKISPHPSVFDRALHIPEFSHDQPFITPTIAHSLLLSILRSLWRFRKPKGRGSDLSPPLQAHIPGMLQEPRLLISGTSLLLLLGYLCFYGILLFLLLF